MSKVSSKTAGRKAGAAEPVAYCSTSMRDNWNSLSDLQLVRAVELMIAPSDLAIRDTAITLLEILGFTPEEVAEQLESGEYLNDGPVFDTLSEWPKIINL